MTTVNETPGSAPGTTPAPSPQTVDAQDKIARLRAIADEFPDDVSPKPLTAAELRLANTTSVVFMEKAAIFAEAAPTIGLALSVDTASLRDAIASDLANGGVIDESKTLTRRVEMATLRKKLKAAKVARDIYRLAKGYAATDQGNAVKPHVLEMKRTLRAKHRKAKKPVAATGLLESVPPAGQQE